MSDRDWIADLPKVVVPSLGPLPDEVLMHRLYDEAVSKNGVERFLRFSFSERNIAVHDGPISAQ
jgi:hypothetical protein